MLELLQQRIADAASIETFQKICDFLPRSQNTNKFKANKIYLMERFARIPVVRAAE